MRTTETYIGVQFKLANFARFTALQLDGKLSKVSGLDERGRVVYLTTEQAIDRILAGMNVYADVDVTGGAA